MAKRGSKALWILFFFSILSILPFGAAAQSQEKIYAALLLNFARSIQWPATKGGGNFVIGVLEYPPLTIALNQSSNNLKVGMKGIEIRELQNESEAKKCHVIFIPAYKAKLLPKVIAESRSGPMLIVTNKFDLARKGSGINFILIDGKLKYEINCKSIEQRGLKIPASVKNLGVIVD